MNAISTTDSRTWNDANGDFSIYNPDVSPRYPLNAVRVKNSTALHLVEITGRELLDITDVVQLVRCFPRRPGKDKGERQQHLHGDDREQCCVLR